MYSVPCLNENRSLVESAGPEPSIPEGQYKGKHDFVQLCLFNRLTSRRNYGNGNEMVATEKGNKKKQEKKKSPPQKNNQGLYCYF